MYCKECGAEISDGKFCSECGRSLNQINKSTNKKDTSWICTGCKTPLPDKPSYCPGCGKKMKYPDDKQITQKPKHKNTKRNLLLLFGIIIIIGGGLWILGSLNHTSSTNHFSNAYVSFNYPSNWYVYQDNSNNGNIAILLNDSSDNGTNNVDSLTLDTSNPVQMQYELNSKYQYLTNKNTTPTGYKIIWYNASDGVNYSGGILSGSGFYSGPTSIGAFIVNGTNIYWLDIESSNSNLTADDSQCYTTIINSIHFK